MRYTFHTTDVFTDRLFGGNPLAVLPEATGLSTAQMQAITREFNLSETAFVLPAEDETHDVRVRIFTPGAELPFAGHPTVGTALVLAWIGAIDLGPDGADVTLGEGVGPVPVRITATAGKATRAQLSVAKLPEIGPELSATEAARLLCLEPADILAAGTERPVVGSCGLPFLIVPVATLDALARAKVDVANRDAIMSGLVTKDVYLVAQEGGEIRTRMLGHDIPEDPATGSAASALAGYLAQQSSQTDGTLTWTVHQGIEMGRPSTIELEADLAGGAITAVRVAGSAVPVSTGQIDVPDL